MTNNIIASSTVYPQTSAHNRYLPISHVSHEKDIDINQELMGENTITALVFVHRIQLNTSRDTLLMDGLTQTIKEFRKVIGVDIIITPQTNNGFCFALPAHHKSPRNYNITSCCSRARRGSRNSNRLQHIQSW